MSCGVSIRESRLPLFLIAIKYLITVSRRERDFIPLHTHSAGTGVQQELTKGKAQLLLR